LTFVAKKDNHGHMSDFNWTCSHCDRHVTITDIRHSVGNHTLNGGNAEGQRTLRSQFIICPNPACRKFTLLVELYESRYLGNGVLDHVKMLQQWRLVPPSASKCFPNYVPKPILEDYGEACLIRDLSPKASATLSRRCLQGILRDFWKVKPGRLVDEIDQVKDKIDPISWEAIEAVRKLGNIGAHMEKDINVIVEVDTNEAALLIELVETLLKEWYVAREDRRVRFTAVIAAAAAKKK
jgi:hypothetical protein